MISGASLASAQGVVQYSGLDAGIGPGDPRPNSDAMLALFDASAVLLGDRTLNVLDFETTNLGLFLNLSPADIGLAGLSILASPEGGVGTDVIGIDEVRWVLIPEPGVALLLVFSGLILACRRR